MNQTQSGKKPRLGQTGEKKNGLADSSRPLILGIRSFLFRRPLLWLVGLLSLSLSLVTLVQGQNFVGPSNSAGVGNGAIGINSSYNLSIGTSTPASDSKLLIVGTSTNSSYYAIKVINLNTGPLFVVRNDGSVVIGGNNIIQSSSTLATSTVSGVGLPPPNGALFVNGPIFSSLNVSALGGLAVGTSTPQSGGNLYVSGNITAGGTLSGTNSGTSNASNVSAGQFGSNTGGGNYSFPASLSVNTSTAPSGGVAYFNGNVGIGEPNPAYELEIAESSLGAANQLFLAQNNGTGGVHGWKIGASGTTGGIYFTRYQNSVGTTAMVITADGNVELGSPALTTTAANGFPYIGAVAGVPTVTPTTLTGFAPLVVDTTDSALYFYANSKWIKLPGVPDPPQVTDYSSPGSFNYNKPAGARGLLIISIGGGGGGGSPYVGSGCGGGSGARVDDYIPNPPTSVTGSIGSGGAAPGGGNTNGNAGTATTINANGTVSAITAGGGGGGGAGGYGCIYVGGGGTASGGSGNALLLKGSDGGGPTNTVYPCGGPGGASLWNGSISNPTNSPSPNNATWADGGGGAGGNNGGGGSCGSTANLGAAGASGRVRFVAFF